MHWNERPGQTEQDIRSQIDSIPDVPLHDGEGAQWTTGEFTDEELRVILKKLKYRKAPGPDETPTEYYKLLGRRGRQEILHIINQWCEGDDPLPQEITTARVVMIFKKGDAMKLSNFRPISLLNTMYKILACMVHSRIAGAIDKYVNNLQFGFRAERGTTEAIAIARRIADIGQATNEKVNMLLLDWEKAFDKVRHAALLKALKRMQIHPEMLKVVEKIYRHPCFFTEIVADSSTIRQQRNGIRQGCPLSPYLLGCYDGDVPRHT